MTAHSDTILILLHLKPEVETNLLYDTSDLLNEKYTSWELGNHIQNKQRQRHLLLFKQDTLQWQRKHDWRRGGEIKDGSHQQLKTAF